MNYYCKYCGAKASSIASLTSLPCSRHPNGTNKGKHALYEGPEKNKYECTHCGVSASSIATLTSLPCSRHPNGTNKGRHEPAM
jgi:DNA-directed RNA polymerase subunit RPC12/RpoP